MSQCSSHCELFTNLVKGYGLLPQKAATTDCATGAKRRRQFDLSSWKLPKRCSLTEWISEYKLDGSVEISTESDSEIGDGTSSRVYCGYYNGEAVAVKQLKCYQPRFSMADHKSHVI